LNKLVVTQSENTAGRDIAAGAIHNTTYNYQPSALRELADKFRIEADSDKHLSAFIENLQHFISIVPQSPSRDLQTN